MSTHRYDTIHSVVDLTRLSEDLLAVVSQTTQPKHTSRWLRPTEHGPVLEGPGTAVRAYQHPPAIGPATQAHDWMRPEEYTPLK